MSCENPDNDKREKKRGRYRLYLEPGQRVGVPYSTERSRRLRREAAQVGMVTGSTEDHVNPASSSQNIAVDEMLIDSSLTALSHYSQGFLTTFAATDPRYFVSATTAASVGDPLDFQDLPSLQTAQDHVASEMDIMVMADSATGRHGHESNIEEQLCIGGCTCGSRCDVRVSTDNELPETDDTGADAGSSKQNQERYRWNDPIHPSVPTTRFEVLLLVLHLSFRHALTGPCITDILKCVNTIFGEHVIPTSQHIFQLLFTPQCVLKYHFFCPNCEFYLGEQSSFIDPTVVCTSCQNNCNVKQLKDNFFITLSLKEQIELLLRKPGLKLVDRRNRPEGLSDLIDGECYQQHCQQGNSLSLTLNTDGAQVFKSSKGSLWPIQFIINEIVAEERFKPANVTMCGLWFGSGSPNMAAFFKPLKEELAQLAVHGVRKFHPDGTSVLCPVYALLCTVDSVAKPKLQSIKQFNGSFGCGYCLHPNFSVEGHHLTNQKRYLAIDRDKNVLTFPYRSHDSMIDDMIKADMLDRQGLLKRSKVGTPNETFDHVNGLKGISALADVESFDVCFGFPIDYLHAVLSGVVDSLASLWFDSSSSGNRYYLGPYIHIIDARLENIRPPQSMTRRPRPMSDRSLFKAKEWRAFLLYYSLPCLEDLMDEVYFKHLQKLVISCHVLLQDRITPGQLQEADSLLHEFVLDYNKLYGGINMVYNVHLLSHLVTVVKMWGPLWAYSLFCFESGNGHLIKVVKGTGGIISQICRKYLTTRSVSDLLDRYEVSDRVLDFCAEIMSFEYVKKCLRVGDCVALGAQVVSQITQDEQLAFTECNIFLLTDFLVYYNRVVRSGVVFYSRAYKKPQRFDDTCVMMADLSYAIVEKIVKLPMYDELYVLISPLRISEQQHLTHHIKSCAIDAFCPLKLVEFSFVCQKCVRVSVGSKVFICDVPNTYEKD